MKLAILNTSILTNDGSYSLKSISLDEAIAWVDAFGGNIDSAIGHESTAQILTELLGIEVPVNRQMFAQEVEQKALVFKLNGRPPEGKILNREEVEAIGYSFKLLTRTA
jgi:hypothetical protein